MDVRVSAFCSQAVQSSLLSETQCAILREMAGDGATIDEFVEMAVSFNVAAEPEKVIALGRRIAADDEKALLAAAGAEAAGPTRAPEAAIDPAGRSAGPRPAAASKKPKGAAAENLGMDWFCFLAITAGCLTREVCVQMMAEVDDISDVIGFAQDVIDNWLSDDYARVQKFLDQAFVLTGKGLFPPFSVYAESRGLA